VIAAKSRGTRAHRSRHTDVETFSEEFCVLRFDNHQVSPAHEALERQYLDLLRSALVSEASSLMRPKVLLVEGELLLGIAIKKLLTDLGFETVGPARDADEANWFVGATPDRHAAVLDLDLGKDTVWPLARQLMSQRTPFLFIAGDASASDLPSDLGHSKILLKPFDQKALGEAIAQIVEQARP
jgi:CheY-like chemotaxis protein